MSSMPRRGSRATRRPARSSSTLVPGRCSAMRSVPALRPAGAPCCAGLGAHRSPPAPTPRSSVVSASCGCWTTPSTARRRQREPQLVTVIGEPGIGKSRLARELSCTPRRRARRCSRADACPTDWGSPTGRSARWSSRRRAGGRSRRSPPACPTGRPPRPRSPARSAWARARRARRRLGASGSSSPPSRATARWCSLFEDVHWAEPPLLDLVDDLVARADRRAGAAALPRPARAARRPPGVGFGAAGTTVVRLGPLSADESRRLLAAPQRASRTPQRTAVAARAGGNPLFLEQLAVHVAERDGAPTLPPALHALLAARLDLLAPPERSLLDAAAIEGERFHLGGVLALVGDAQEADARPQPGHARRDRELLLSAPARDRRRARVAVPPRAGARRRLRVDAQGRAGARPRAFASWLAS